VKESDLAAIVPEFKFTVTKIRKFAEPELNDEFFAMAFPDGSVKDAAALSEYFDRQIAAELDRESEFLFTAQLRKYLLDKAGITLPEDFLKRWLFTINEGKFSMEDIERDLPEFLAMMKWNIIQKRLADKLGVKVEQEDMIAEAKAYAAAQFAQYGMMNVEDDMLTQYAHSILDNKGEANKILDRLHEKKVVEAVKPLIKITGKRVPADEIGKIYEKLK
jgi:trigger factor